MTKKLTDAQKKEREENKRKLALIERSRSGHKPGTRHTSPDGTNYVVMPNGAWLRVTPKAQELHVFGPRMDRMRIKFPDNKAVL